MQVLKIQQALERLMAEGPVKCDPYIVECDDGAQVQTNHRHLYLSSLFFELNAKYDLPILGHHLIETTLKGKPMSTSTVSDHLTKYSRDICTMAPYHGEQTIKQMSRDIIEMNNKVHNIMTTVSMSSQVSISILDFLDVVHHPDVATIFDEVTTNKIPIKVAYSRMSKFLNTTADLPGNNVLRAVRTKMANENQVMQCLMVRGFPTEVNGDIMPLAVMTNFTKGMRKVYDYVAETRSAAKSYYFTEEPMQKSEYFARRLQLVTMNVQRLHYGHDCGSTSYMRWPVIKAPQFDAEGILTYPGDLNFMTGIYYVDEVTNTLKTIKGDEKHLYDKPLLIRSVLTCKHHDKGGTCEVCFGELARNIPPTSNLGHTCACVMTQQSTQSVLSNKHLDASSVAVALVLEQMAMQYFERPDKHQTLKVKAYYQDKGLKLTLDKDNVRGITDLEFVENIDRLNHSRITAVINALFTHEERGKQISNIVRIAQSARRGYLSKDFLKYVKVKGYTLDPKGNFVFDMSEWNYKQPVFQFTKKEQNYSQHSQEIAVMIESSMEEITEREKPDSPQQTLYELFNLVNHKLNVHLSCLQVIIYAFMIPEKGNYDLARGAKSPVLGVYNQIMANRSLSAAYIYKDLAKVMTSVGSFSKNNRPDHPVDVYFDPDAVMRDHALQPDELRRHQHPNKDWTGLKYKSQ